MPLFSADESFEHTRIKVYSIRWVWEFVVVSITVKIFAARGGLLEEGAAAMGKTSHQILAMAFGRWRVALLEGAETPGWRRGSGIDVFRETPGALWEAIILDDPEPALDMLSFERIKAFFDVGENTVCDCRYTPAKFERTDLDDSQQSPVEELD